MNRLGLKIFCLAASIIIWVIVAYDSDVEQNAELPLRIVELDKSLTYAGSELVDEVSVRLKGKKIEFFKNRYFKGYLGEVRINLSGQEPGPKFSREVVMGDVFVTDLTLISIIRPPKLRLHIDRVETKKMPVRLETDGSLPVGTDFLVKPTVSPDSILVTGASRYFEDDGVVPTLRVNLDKLKESQEFPLALITPHEYLHLARSEVSATFKLAQIVNRTLANIKVIPLVDAGQFEVGVSPPVVDVMVRGVADSVQALDRSRVMVTLPVGSLPEGKYVLSGEVDYPPWLDLIGLDPPRFQVIVGNPTAPTDTSVVPGSQTPSPDTPNGGDQFE